MSSIHASCVALDGRGVLIRGAPGSGKSRLAHILLLRAPLYGREARLVADDRTLLENREGVLIARAPDAIAGLLEIRGLGIVRAPHRLESQVACVLDLLPEAEIPRLPFPEDNLVTLDGVTLPRAFAATPERGLDVLLTVFGQFGLSIDTHVPLAPRQEHGKTTWP